MRVHVFITGMVQGVFFRANTEREACRLGLSGWVRNTSNGRVEAVFEGPQEKVEEAVEWCRRGPPAAHVDDVEVRIEAEEGLEGFEVRHG